MGGVGTEEDLLVEDLPPQPEPTAISYVVLGLILCVVGHPFITFAGVMLGAW